MGETDKHEKMERLAAIGEIAAEVAHELRNALQVISANVYLAKQDVAKSAPHLAKIERNARVAHGIVDDLMALARGEPGLVAHAEPVLLSDILALARESLPPPPPSAVPVWVDRIDPPQLEVRAHRGLLSRLFHVLYENAIGVCAPEAATIETRAFRADGNVVLEVTDNGPGVPESIASTIFEPLVSAREGGTGLGLALARRVVHAHSGSIVVIGAGDTRGTGEGKKVATFRVELPA